MIASDQESTAMIKGKRTKRQKHISHLSLTATTTASTTSSSTTTTVSGGGSFGGATTEEEEEDIARCLILLAKKQTSSTRLINVYQCKTCDRSFSSFQALGGHRASHMKPTTMMTKTLEENAVKKSDDSCRNIWSEKIRVHECSMCGAEFSSGQALGGHMRRHRTHALADDDRVESVKIKTKKSRNGMLMLDLNLPAEPEEEDDHDHDDDLGNRRSNFG